MEVSKLINLDAALNFYLFISFNKCVLLVIVHIPKFISLFVMLGSILFLLSGGESNPGPPVLSRLGNYVVEGVSNRVKEFLMKIVNYLIPNQTVKFLKELKNTAIWSVYMIRLFTSVTDFISTFCCRPGLAYVSQIDMSSRLSNLILNLYDTFKMFYSPTEINVFERRVRLQAGFDLSAGGFDTVLVSSLLSSATPTFIKNILFDLPRLSNVKAVDSMIPFIVDLVVFVTSLPRKLFQMFPVSESETGKTFVSVMMSIENMFPFSRMGKVRKDMEQCLMKVRNDPRVLLQELFKREFNDVNKARKIIEKDYLYCNKNLPNYYVNISKDFDELEKKLFVNSSAQRVEPVCIVFCGPPNTGKSVFNTRVLKMYEKCGHRVYVDTIPSDVTNKHHMDLYDNQFIYTADDIGAQSKAQFAYLINMVSVQKYPLEAAEVKYKNTRFFNSRLMLLTTNSVPQNFAAADGVADQEALYRRMHIMSFDKVTFVNGVHKGVIEVKLYDGTQGVKQFTTRRTISLDEGDGLLEVDKYIREELKKKLDHFERNGDESMIPNVESLPDIKLQAGEGLYSYFARVLDNDGVKYFYERSASMMFDISEVITNVFNDNLPTNINISQLFFVIFASVLFSGGVYYSIVRLFPQKKEEEDSDNDEGVCPCCKVDDPESVYSYRYDEYLAGYCMKEPMIESEYYSDEEKKVMLGLQQTQQDKIRKKAMLYEADKKKSRKVVDIINQGFINIKGEVTTPIPQLIRYSKNVMKTRVHYVDLQGKTCEGVVRGLFSFDKLLTVSHVLMNCDYSKDIYITVNFYDQRIYDYMEVKLIENCPEEDWCIFQLPKTAPRFFQRVNFGDEKRMSKDMCLIIGDANVVDLGTEIEKFGIVTKYRIGSFETQIEIDDLMYDFEGEELCGSPLVTKDGMLLGLHVAKATLEDDSVKGVSRLFSLESRNKIREYFMVYGHVIPIKFTGEKRSGCEVVGNFSYFSPNKSKYVKSRVYGMFPTYRKPALELPPEMKDTDILSEKMLELPGEVQLEPLEYAARSLDDILPKESKPLDIDELIAGNPEGLNRIDPSTSCGVDLPGVKEFYIDYEQRKLREPCLQKVNQFVDMIVNDRYDFGDTASVVLKDELKDVSDFKDPLSMPKKVRIFTNYHLVSTLFLRYFLGNLLVKVAREKFVNGIMIGINPLSRDWEKFYNCITKFGRRLFDGDYSNYDNYMHPAFQRRLNAILRKRIKPDYKHFNKVFSTSLSSDEEVLKVYDQMMECIISTPITSRSKKIITTHGLPSGAAITAFYNSCINKMYIAYGYRILVPGKDLSFLRMDIKDAVYGDDVIMNVRPEIRGIFNPRNYAIVMKSLGLGFTPANKGEWTSDNMFKDILECTFLKRGFAYHDKIKQIVAPLDFHSMEGTLNFVSDKNNNDELTEIKIHNFQREAFLHTSEYYNRSMLYVKKILDERDLYIQLLSEDYLIELYQQDDYSQRLELH